jgi:hypothetical protein
MASLYAPRVPLVEQNIGWRTESEGHAWQKKLLPSLFSNAETYEKGK